MKTSRKISGKGPGHPVKVRYLGETKKPEIFIGAATRQEYFFGGRINLGEVDSRDLTTGQSFAPGLLELRGAGGKQLFEIHVPRHEPEPEPEEEGSINDSLQGDHD